MALPRTDDEFFEELSKAVFTGGQNGQAVEARWAGYRRAFSKFNVKRVSDYIPDDVDRLMENPELVRNLRKIEGTIENAAEILVVAIEYGSFADYVKSFDSPADLAEDLSRRFRQITPQAAATFVERATGQALPAA